MAKKRSKKQPNSQDVRDGLVEQPEFDFVEEIPKSTVDDDFETATTITAQNDTPPQETNYVQTGLDDLPITETSPEHDDDNIDFDENIDEDSESKIERILKEDKEKNSIQIIFDYFKSLFKPKESKKNKKKKKFAPVPYDSVDRYNPSYQTGLSSHQVEVRNNQDLVNKTEQRYSKTYASIIITNTCTFFNFLCIGVAIAMACFKTPISNFVFVLVLIANTLIGIIQEVRAKKAIDRLKLMSSNTSKVVRNGYEIDIPTEQIVLDDIVLLQIGNQIPTDSVLVHGTVEVNESLLTGESIPVKKSEGDVLFAGSFITSGSCYARASSVGAQNYISKLSAKAKKYKKPNSELMRSLKLIITAIGIIIIPIAVALFFNNYTNGNYPSLKDALPPVVTRTSAVVIGMIPSGMFLLTSLALSLGVVRLAKNNTMINDLYSLEMLARVNVLCLDKTGTITDGRMKVNDCIILSSAAPNTVAEAMGSLLSAVNDNNQTAIALYNHFGHNNLLKPIKTIPFSSVRKYSGATFADVGTYLVGAPEFVLKDVPEKLEKLIMQYTSLGLRVVVLAYSKTPIANDFTIPSSMKPLALITLSDNIREDAVSTIKWFKENDVQVKVISGDNPITVSEIARRVGVEHAEKFISLEGLSDREIVNVANKYTVFGRVTPEQKAILVKAMKSAGSTVAMTGDGVNDILALKEADCAITVASGSEAARNVSNIVLMDSNFSSMPKVVHEGRRVINNIQNSASLYIMKTIFTTLFALLCLVMQIPYPFTTSMMNMLELSVIGLASLCLSLQPNDKRVRGKFITYVFGKALPSALLMLFSVLAVQIFSLIMKTPNPSITAEHASAIYSTMSVIALTFAGLICLFRLCQPFNVFRGVMFAVIAALVFFWAIYLKTATIGSIKLFDGLTKIEYWHHILFTITVIIADIPLSGCLTFLFNKITSNDKNKK